MRAETRSPACHAMASSNSLTAVNERLLLTLAALAVFPILFLLRGYDNNTLVSWRWVAAGRDGGTLFLLYALGVAAAYAMSAVKWQREYPLVAFLFVLAAAPPLLLAGTPETVIDASRYFTGAKHLELHGFSRFMTDWGTTIDAWTDLPLPALLYGALFTFVGENRTVVQTLNAGLFAGTALFTYLLARLLWGRKAGFCAALLILGSPYVLVQTPLMLGDIMAMFFLAFAAWSTFSYICKGGIPYLCAAAFSYGGALLCKYSLWPAVFLLAMTAPTAMYLSGRRHEIIGRGAVLLALAPFLAAAIVVSNPQLFLAQVSLLIDYQASGLRRWGESHASTFFFQTHPFVTLLALLGTLRALWKREWTCGAILLLPVLAVITGVRRARYLMILMPLLAAAASYGLCTFSDSRFRRLAAWNVALYSAVTALFFYAPFLNGLSLGNLQRAGEYLNGSSQEHIEVILSDEVRSQVNPTIAVPLLDIYTQGDIAFQGAVPVAPQEAGVLVSPFRFSWRYPMPEYYTGVPGADDRSAVVFISGDSAADVPSFIREKMEGHQKATFVRDDGLFNYGTFVTVLVPGLNPSK